MAVSLGYIESARVLLQHKADVTKENAQGWTGKDSLGSDSFSGTCSLFLCGVLVSKHSDTGAVAGFLSVLHEAVSTGDPEMVQLILQHRDYQQTSMTLGGVPELLQKISEVMIY